MAEIRQMPYLDTILPQLVKFDPFWTKSAKPKVTFANAKYANAKACERSVRRLFVKYTNTYRSISVVLRTLSELFCPARYFF